MANELLHEPLKRIFTDIKKVLIFSIKFLTQTFFCQFKKIKAIFSELKNRKI